MIRQEKINEINETINSLKTIRKELIEKSQFITIEPYICYLNNDKKIKRENY